MMHYSSKPLTLHHIIQSKIIYRGVVLFNFRGSWFLFSTETKTEAHSWVSQALSGLNGESFLFLTSWRLDPDPAALWTSSCVSLGETRFKILYLESPREWATSYHCFFHLSLSLSLSASIYEGDEEATPDGICHKMLLQHWQSLFLIVALTKRGSRECAAVSE